MSDPNLVSKPDLIARRIRTPIGLDGNTHKPAWAEAQGSRRFVDMVDGGPSPYDTRAALLWDDTHLYVAFRAEEPFVEARLHERDDLVFLENDLEVLIEGDDCYYELEVNAANTVYEVFFAWRDAFQQHARFQGPAFDLHDPRTHSFAGDFDRTGATFWKGTHPRGSRWAFTGFDLLGLRTAVQVDGSLNDHGDLDQGWQLEIAMPWRSLELLTTARSVPPHAGDLWRIFLGRFHRFMIGGKEVSPHPASVLTAHGVYDTHQPDKWSRIPFVD